MHIACLRGAHRQGLDLERILAPARLDAARSPSPPGDSARRNDTADRVPRLQARRAAIDSPIAAECLKPCPEQGEATSTRGKCGCGSITKPKSAVIV